MDYVLLSWGAASKFFRCGVLLHYIGGFVLGFCISPHVQDSEFACQQMYNAPPCDRRGISSTHHWDCLWLTDLLSGCMQSISASCRHLADEIASHVLRVSVVRAVPMDARTPSTCCYCLAFSGIITFVHAPTSLATPFVPLVSHEAASKLQLT